MKANVNLSLGAIHQVRGQVARAIKCYYASLMIFKSTEDDSRVGHTYYHLGVSHREYGAWARYHYALASVNKIGAGGVHAKQLQNALDQLGKRVNDTSDAE